MKILYISHKIPYPLSDGGKLRVFNHIKHLSKKHDITSLSFIESKDELKNIEELRKLCSVETVLLPKKKSLLSSFRGLFSRKPLRMHYLKDRSFRKKAIKLTKEADLVIVQALRMTQYAFAPEKTIVDIVDTPSLQIRRALRHESFVWKLIWALELPRIMKFERLISRRFSRILVASEADRKALGRGKVIKNGTAIDKISRRPPEKNNIMFLGNMEYAPNIDAVEFFIRRIFPMIKKAVPDARFFIVGKNADRMKRYARKDIIVTGFVPDLEEFFSQCKVFAAPLRIGSGIQNKVLEALNFEIPVIMTSIVNAGVEAEDGKEILIADDPKSFAQKTIALLGNDKLRKRLSKYGKSCLKRNYSWKKVNTQLDRLMHESIQENL